MKIGNIKAKFVGMRTPALGVQVVGGRSDKINIERQGCEKIDPGYFLVLFAVAVFLFVRKPDLVLRTDVAGNAAAEDVVL